MEGNYLARNSHKGESFGFHEDHTTTTWGTTSWPARNYACSFCKREFKSAQALGGHMNVHRRDRARLRSSLSSSWVSHHDQCSSSSTPPPKPNPSCTKANPTTNHLSLPSSSSTTTSPSSYLSNALLNCAHLSPLYCPCLTLSTSPASACGGDKKPRLSSFQIPPLSPQRREININKDTLKSGLEVEGLLVQGCGSCDQMEDEDKVLETSTNEHNITLELGIGFLEHPKEKLDLELRLGH